MPKEMREGDTARAGRGEPQAMSASVRCYYHAGHEQFAPEQLLTHAVHEQRSGFDGIACSDHLQPWWEPGQSGHAWVWLGAAGQATERVPLGTAVTPVGARYHPVLIAQAWGKFAKGATGKVVRITPAGCLRRGPPGRALRRGGLPWTSMTLSTPRPNGQPFSRWANRG